MAVTDRLSDEHPSLTWRHGTGASRRPIAILFTASVLWLVLLLLFEVELSHLSLTHAALVTVTSAACMGLLIYRTDLRGTFAFPFLHFLVLSVFHCGLYLTFLLPARTTTSLTGLHLTWFDKGAGVRAAYLVSLGLVCYAVGYAVSQLLGRRWRFGHRDGDDHPKTFHEHSRGLTAVGCAVTVVATTAWFLISTIQAGFGFFLGSYLTYLRETSGSALPWTYLGISLGATLCSLGIRDRLGRIGLITLGVFAVPAFLLGLRGEVLFPLVAVVGVLGCQRRLWSDRKFWLACTIVLLGISFVSQARIDGLGAVSRSDVALSPIRAVAEMGFSVRPVYTSVSWHEHGAEPFLDGSTYWAPVERQVRGLLGLPVPDAQNDYRLMNVEIGNRVGPIGGSVIAEAHHNAGTAGVAVVLGLWGLLSGLLFRHPQSAVRVAFSGLVAVLLLMHVRNSFAPIPAWGMLGCVLIVLGLVAGKILAHREAGNHIRGGL